MRTLAVVVALAVASPLTTSADSRPPSLASLLRTGTPLAVAVDEFNEDGARDLVGAYRNADGGGLVVTWHGDPTALVACGNSAPRAVLHSPSAFVTDVVPELIATGDFDNDGHRDVAVAARGERAVTILAGDGAGAVSMMRRLDVDGAITTLAAGDVNLADGLADLVVGVSDEAGSRLLVFEGPEGALAASPERIEIAGVARNVRIGQFDGETFGDVEAECGAETIVVVGRNRCVLAGPSPRPVAAPIVRTRLEGHASSAPATVSSAMRLNGDAIDDTVELIPGAVEPSVRLTSPRATFTVTSADDSGPGTLRAAILQSNASEGADEIDFSIGSGARTIALETPLPEILDSVTIDGTSQPGFSGEPLIEITGSGTVESGVTVTAGNSALRGLSFNRFPFNEEGTNAAVLLKDRGSNRVEGCVFGTNAAGDELGNGRAIGLDHSTGNTIGSPVDGARNVFGWNGDGILVHFDSSGTVIQNNVFGMNASLTVPTPNSIGTRIDDVPRNLVGGVLPGEGNIAVTNGSYGIDIISNFAAENLIQGNYVGTTPDRRPGLGNYEGIGICGGADNGAKSNLVGGTAVGASNLVSGNAFGVSIGTSPQVDATENRVLCNEIAGNMLIGIDLGKDEFSFNDPGDRDVGPNEQQNAPLLESLKVEGDTALVTGTLFSRPNESFRIEFFSGAGSTELGFGDGGTFAGTANVTTDNAGNGGLAVTLSTDLLRGDSIVATATDASGDTSEFSISLALDVSWEPPDPGAGTNPPPRNPSVRVQGTGDDGRVDAASPRALLGYKVYRGSSSDFQISPANLFVSLPPTTTLPTFVLGSGAFFRITACYDTGESAPTDAIPGGVPPTISSLAYKGGKIVALGSGFTGGVVEFANGIPFRIRAKVKLGGTKTVQKGQPLAGNDIDDIIRDNGFVTVLIRNATGGTAFGRLTN